MLEKKKRTYIFLKWAIGIALLLLIIFGCLAWFLNVKYKPVITSEIKSLIYKSSDGLYTIDFTNVTTNLLTGHASLKNVKIHADTNRFKQLIALKRAPNNLYTVQVKKLLIKNFHPFSILNDRKLNIDLVLFDKPEVLMVNKQFDFNENRPPQPIKSPYDFIKKILNEFSIETIEFRDASFKYKNDNVAKPSLFSINKLNIVLKDLLIDSTSAKDLKRLYLLKDVLVCLNDYSYDTPNKRYTVKLNQLVFKASTGALNIKKFSFNPLYNEMKFGQFVGYNVDRYLVQMNDISVQGINLPLYIRKQELRAKEMSVSNGLVAVFNDSSLPKSKIKQTNSFPHQLLQHINLPIQLQKIILNNVGISYSVYSGKSKQSGRVSFEHTSGIISNVTNLIDVKTKDSISKVSLVTYLMGQGKLDIKFQFNLMSNTGAFSYKGVLHSLNARLINGITKPLGLVQINRGNVDKLEFAFNADNAKAIGKVDFKYYDLSVALMRNDEEKGKLVKRGLLSFLANALMINPENPDQDGKFISAPVTYNRIPNTSFFNLIWRSLFQGIKTSIGLTEEKQLKMATHIAKFKAIRASRRERKRNRAERKIEREKVEMDQNER